MGEEVDGILMATSSSIIGREATGVCPHLHLSPILRQAEDGEDLEAVWDSFESLTLALSQREREPDNRHSFSPLPLGEGQGVRALSHSARMQSFVANPK
jgi:hypothetical protein